jgi:carbamoyl-phosphate synthase/aspartate carbamoyltransferase
MQLTYFAFVFQAPMFSFTRLRGADPTLGVEMASTGEVACFGDDAHEAFLQALLSTGFKLPNRNRSILLSFLASDQFRAEFEESVTILDKLGFKLYGTPGTSKYYKEHLGIDMIVVEKPENEDDDKKDGNALKVIKEGKIDMVINVSEGASRRDEITAGYCIRRAAVDFDVSLVTNVKCAIQLVECMNRGTEKKRPPQHIGEFYRLPIMGWTKS